MVGPREAVRSVSAKRSRRSLELVRGVVEAVVVDHVRELVRGGELGLGDLAGAPRSARASSVPRPISRVRSASSDGGAMKMRIASGIVSATWRAPWTSISSTTGAPSAVRRSSSERSVP